MFYIIARKDRFSLENWSAFSFLEKSATMGTMDASHATLEGTARYRSRFEGKLDLGHFRQSLDLWISSIGCGTYLGDPDEATDCLYLEALVQAVESGSNVIDTAINYRLQQSERVIGKALKLLFEKGYGREELILSTKGGFIPCDAHLPLDSETYFQEMLVKPGIVTSGDLVAGCHCMTPSYLDHELETSLKNLGLACIDIYFLHNPETQLEEVPPQEFHRRIEAAFRLLEKKVAEGKIRYYGTATWEGYRNHPNAGNHLDLQELAVIARSVGGEKHHFRVIQLPHNLAMPEAIAHQNQKLGPQMVSTLEAAERLGIAVYASASLLQGRVAQNLPQTLRERFKHVASDAQRSLQFVRSTPGLTTALVGMKTKAHVTENMGLAATAPLTREEFFGLFAEEKS